MKISHNKISHTLKNEHVGMILKKFCQTMKKSPYETRNNNENFKTNREANRDRE